MIKWKPFLNCAGCDLQIVWPKRYCKDCIKAFTNIGVNMNKQEAMKRLEAAEAEIAACKAIINTPDAPAKRFINGVHVELLCLKGQNYNIIRYTPQFANSEVAKDFLDAFQVMLELRACDGVIPFALNTPCYVIVYCVYGERLEIKKLNYPVNAELRGDLCPLFKDAASCGAALHKVGMKRIINAIKTLQFME